MDLNIVTVNPVELPELLKLFNGIFVKSSFDTGTDLCFISCTIYKKYFCYKKLIYSSVVAHSAQESVSVNRVGVDLDVEICCEKKCMAVSSY